jgi:hypothetical protein
MTKSNGSPRGRPKGSKNKRTIGRELSAYRMEQNCERYRAGLPPVRLSQATVTPLDVMEDNMEWARFEAAKHLETIMRKAESEGDAKTQLAAFQELVELRKLANSFAERAAPYRHSTLIAVAPPPPEKEPEYVFTTC